MRSLALSLPLLLALLSGCVAEEESPEDPLFAVCPQWVAGPGVAGDAAVAGEAVLALAPRGDDGALVVEHDGFPLDLYVLRLDVNGTVEVRARTQDGRDLLLRDTAAVEPDSRPRFTVSGEAELAVYLTAVPHGAPADPQGIELLLEGDGTVAVEGTAWYRVCGAVVEAPEDH